MSTKEISFMATEPAKKADLSLPLENTSEVHQSIIEQFAGLPVRERLKMLHYLNQAAHTDADNLSAGRVETNGHYDKVKEIYAGGTAAEKSDFETTMEKANAEITDAHNTALNDQAQQEKPVTEEPKPE